MERRWRAQHALPERRTKPIPPNEAHRAKTNPLVVWAIHVGRAPHAVVPPGSKTTCGARLPPSAERSQSRRTNPIAPNEANRAERTQSRRTNPIAPNEPIARVARTSGWPGLAGRSGRRSRRGTGQSAAAQSGRDSPPASCRSATRTGKRSGPPGEPSRARTNPAAPNEARIRRSRSPNEPSRAERTQPRRTKPSAPNEANRTERLIMSGADTRTHENGWFGRAERTSMPGAHCQPTGVRLYPKAPIPKRGQPLPRGSVSESAGSAGRERGTLRGSWRTRTDVQPGGRSCR